MRFQIDQIDVDNRDYHQLSQNETLPDSETRLCGNHLISERSSKLFALHEIDDLH